MNRSRREADDTIVQLQETKKHNELLQHEGEVELEKARVPNVNTCITKSC